MRRRGKAIQSCFVGFRHARRFGDLIRKTPILEQTEGAGAGGRRDEEARVWPGVAAGGLGERARVGEAFYRKRIDNAGDGLGGLSVGLRDAHKARPSLDSSPRLIATCH